ncbi:DsbA family protein [Maridesulfovibrio sp.]|uniref:DsbA family protein n=1 Tax=Maridesulfovibrio sp. TaxID=2795000 RepID=UPI0039EF3889
MLKKFFAALLLFLLVSGCVNKQILKEQITEAIKENPQIVLDAMRENSVDMLEIVEQGIDQREKIKREAVFNAEIAKPYQPVINAERPMLGNPDAPVTIVEYTDFLCPYCSKGAKVVSKLAAEHPQKYKLVFKHLPLHKNSRQLALVFEALALSNKEQAFKFHDLVFQNQKQLYDDASGAVLGRILAEVGVDNEQLQKNIRNKKLQQYLADDEAEAKKFDINATPTFLVNGVSIRGYLPVERFEGMVDVILEKSEAKEGVDTPEGEICEDCLNQM